MSDERSRDFGPEQVRALRGERSRAAFAQLLGVTPLTIYRWELPDGAAQVRRPRGAALARLRQLAGAAPPDGAPLHPPTASTEGGAGSLARQEEALVLPSLERLVRGDWRRAETELLALHVDKSLRTAEAQALAATGLAQIQLLLRSDARSALATILTALDDAQSGRLPPAVEALVHAAAALVFSWPDGQLFDFGRVNLHAERAEALGGPHATEVRFCARLAGGLAAFVLSDAALLARAIGRLGDLLDASLPPLLHGYAEEFRALAAWVTGKTVLATRAFERLARQAESAGYPCLQARALGFLSVRLLDDLSDPQSGLAAARRAQSCAREARLGLGLHTMFAASAEAEALLRLARLDEAALVLEEAERTLEGADVPPTALVTTLVRLYVLDGRRESLEKLAARLQARADRARGAARPPLASASLPAYAAYVRAFGELCAPAADGQRVVAAFRDAERQALEWVLLLRDVVVAMVPALLAAGQLEQARLAVRRAQRFFDRYPSPWRTALLRQWEGTLLVRQSRWPEGRQLLEAALGTFELAGDLPQAALTRRTLLLLGRLAGDPEAAPRLSESEEALRRMRVAASAWPSLDPAPLAQASREELPAGAGPTLHALVSTAKRLSVSGVAPPLIQRELLATLGALLGGRAVRIEEVDSAGAAESVGEVGGAPDGPLEWFEFGDGSGRRLRAGIAGALSDSQRSAVALMTQVASLSLEVAALRGLTDPRDPPPGSPDPTPELPGFIAASPAMRRLKAELSRLSGSRATVVIVGESGAGKEVVARALHGLSARAGRPHVAFNCASVPRDLFEGQLFGYRRGAFTGAATDHPGVIRSAHGGTLFLDEIGELPLDVQPKLLRFLENGEISPLGEPRPATVDVRVIAATHRDLAAMVRERSFREDLFYRLQVVTLRIPPLRERREDIVPLARHFLRLYASDGEPPVLSADAVARLATADWPGNVRELRNVIERAMAFSPAPAVLTAAMLRFQ